MKLGNFSRAGKLEAQLEKAGPCVTLGKFAPEVFNLRTRTLYAVKSIVFDEWKQGPCDELEGFWNCKLGLS